MKLLLLLGLLFLLLRHGDAQETSTAPTTTTSLTPAMSSASVAAFFSALATTAPQQPGNGEPAGDAGSVSTPGGDSDAGASGTDSESITLSRGAIIAIIVIVVSVIIFGIVSATLFYIAKKRSWEVRKSIRRSAKKVATALTPRRTTFPKDVRRGSRGLQRIDEVPPTPRRGSNDVEKASAKLEAFEFSEPPKKSRWNRKIGR